MLAAAFLCSLIGASAASAQAVPVATPVDIGASSVTWNWTATPGATGYRVLLVSAAGANVGPTNVSGDLAGTVTTFDEIGLSTNEVYGIIVEAFGTGFTVDSATTTVLSAAAVPSGTMLLGTNNNQVSLSWVMDGNPVGVTYNVNWTTSTGIGILFSTSSPQNVAVFTDSASATITDLPGGMTINFDVQAVNSSGVASGFDVIVTTTIPTLSNQPFISSATFAAGVSSITWYWSASTGAIAYQLFSSTNGAVSPLLPATTLTYTQTGLSTNTAYSDYVFAFGVPVSTASAPYTQYTLAAQTTALTLLGLILPPASGVVSPTESISWGANGNPAGTNYSVLWWTNLTSTVTFSTGTTSALVPNLYGGSTLYFTVQAVNFQASTAAFDTTFFGVIPSTFIAASAQLLPVGYSGIVTFVVPNGAGTGSGVVSVQIASGTFSSAVTLAVSTPNAQPPFPLVGGPVADLPNPIHLTISALDAFDAPQQPILPVLLKVSYAASNFSANQTTLDISRFDAIRQVWIPLATSKQANTLSALTDHFSSFAVLSVAAAADLTSISVGPNPLRPILNPGAVMTFRNLPAGCRVRIFTYVGEKLVDLIADGSGVVAWTGRNHVGSYVASGVYIAIIEGAGTKRTIRVAIER
jgi:hypothetical protein